MQWTVGPWCEFVEAKHIDEVRLIIAYIYIIYVIYEFAVCPSVLTLHWVSNEATRIAQR